MKRTLKLCAIAWVVAGVCAAGIGGARACGQTTYFEQEPNDSPVAATIAEPFAVGDTITGVSRGTATSGTSELTVDYLALWLAPGPGINRVEITLTHPQASLIAMTMRGASQVGGVLFPATQAEVVASTLATPTTRTIRVYVSGGTPAKVLLRITGRSATTAEYSIAMTAEPVAAQQISGLYPGPVTITTAGQGNTADTELWLFDASGYPIPGWGNDDISPAASGAPFSRLVRTLTAGRYFLAVSDSDMAVSEPNPSDDSNRSRPATEHRGIVVGTSSAVNVPLNFNLLSVPTDGSPVVSRTVQATKTLVNQVMWYELLVGIPAECSVADVSGGSDGTPDGVLDGGDYIAFINAFASGGGLADIVSGSGMAPGDGVVDGNDYIAFINAFAAGC